MCLVSTPHVPGTDGFERSNAVGQDLHRLHPIGLCGGPQGSPPSGARVVLGRGEPRTELVPIGFQTAKPKGEETRPPGDENEGTVDRRGTGGMPCGVGPRTVLHGCWSTGGGWEAWTGTTPGRSSRWGTAITRCFGWPNSTPHGGMVKDEVQSTWIRRMWKTHHHNRPQANAMDGT